jgi:hypothetical protein
MTPHWWSKEKMGKMEKHPVLVIFLDSLDPLSAGQSGNAVLTGEARQATSLTGMTT